MEVRFYVDPDTRQPHIYGHGITEEEVTMSEQRYPPGWDEDRVQEVLAHYEDQTEDEQFAEIEAAREAEDITLMAVPTELVPQVRDLLARGRTA